jgi:hypothetical protein
MPSPYHRARLVRNRLMRFPAHDHGAQGRRSGQREKPSALDSWQPIGAIARMGGDRVILLAVKASTLKAAIMACYFDGTLSHADVEILFANYELEHD